MSAGFSEGRGESRGRDRLVPCRVAPQRRRATAPARLVAAALSAVVALVSLVALPQPPPALAQPAAEAPEARFSRAAEALGKGEHGAAIDELEALSDRGYLHPDASFNRGLAYAMRARARGAERPGDLGKAAAALEETLRLRPGDEGAERMLESVRAEITRRRARRAGDEIDVRPTLGRAFVGLLEERTWSLLALAASALFALGLALRKRQERRAHVAGSVLAPIAGVALAALAPTAYAAFVRRTETREAVVVVPDLYLQGEDGDAAPGPPIPEGALIEVGERQGERIHARAGSREGYVSLTSVRLLPP